MLASPRGFCAGVVRAIEIVERTLDSQGAPVYVYHEIVHNGHVVDGLRARGAIFVNDLADIPVGAVTVFSAHGVSNAIVDEARARGLRVIDATCPLVAKVHTQARQYAQRGYSLILVGHPGHEEIVGTMGSVDKPMHLVSTVQDVEKLVLPEGDSVAYVTQTTLSVDDTRSIITALVRRFPNIEGPELDDICYATLNRQRAVRAMAKEVDLILVVGSRNSSNTNRLREVAAQEGLAAYLVENASQLQPEWFSGTARVGVTAGASAPEVLVEQVMERLRREFGAGRAVQQVGEPEKVSFKLPPLLAAAG
ncbi:MAG: 4-hydroxy-3-methylbut-2-enyl diphosphate reductase [Proteobacteria bacterium]|jgi:4-hydroxy-3-methylbut-2-enyl diphosphate reductase|nr:4-hydroxy-3-methylbut-2-enyl diphosphate reductase [Pseudomonadota bacterium]